MKVERSDVKFPLWRKKVDTSLFTKSDTPIPNWLSKIWDIETVFGTTNSRKNVNSEVKIKIDRMLFQGWVTFSKYQSKDTNYKLQFNKDLTEKLKDLFIMSYMRTLENRLRNEKNELTKEENGVKENEVLPYPNDVEDDIPFWEFLDIEFDRNKRVFNCKAHYTQKPLFPELFKQFVRSHLLKEIENKLIGKGDFKFEKDNWRPRSEIKTLLGRPNIIYYLIDTKNRLLYIGESINTKRISQLRKEIPSWDYFRIDWLPEWLSREQRLELERLIIRSFASVLTNSTKLNTKKISDYTLVNKKIDT